MEAKRQLDVLDKQLARGRYVAGEEYTIADMAVWPWYGNVVLGNVYNAAEFLDAGSYKKRAALGAGCRQPPGRQARTHRQPHQRPAQ
ncbi:Glutathione S-transferase [Klebsiella pneumoniae ISC21]|nr:Glutathione S-transferase [Klebsiella pneumoniae ISC21]